MKLQNFIIGLGLFGLFTIIIFGAINPENSYSIYGENYLNTTVDSNTTKTIKSFSDVGDNTSRDFGLVSGDIEEFTTDRGTDEEASEGNLLSEGIKLLFAIPRFFGTISSGLGRIGAAIGIPQIFINWVVLSIVVIIVLIIATAFLRNRLVS